jgi:hypothetical protein
VLFDDHAQRTTAHEPAQPQLTLRSLQCVHLGRQAVTLLLQHILQLRHLLQLRGDLLHPLVLVLHCTHVAVVLTDRAHYSRRGCGAGSARDVDAGRAARVRARARGGGGGG